MDIVVFSGVEGLHPGQNSNQHNYSRHTEATSTASHHNDSRHTEATSTASHHNDSRHTEATSTASQVLNPNPNIDQGNKSNASILTKQFENADKHNEKISPNLKMANPSESSNVMSEGKAKAETDIKKKDGEGDANDDDDDSSDEDTSYCKYCKRSFSSSVVSI